MLAATRQARFLRWDAGLFFTSGGFREMMGSAAHARAVASYRVIEEWT